MLSSTHRAASLAVVASCLLFPACSTTGTPGDEASPGRSRSSGVLTAEDLAQVYDYNALQAVELLRPMWLRNRGPVTMNSTVSQGVRLYVDGTPWGFAVDMEGVLVSDVREIRFLDSREATTRYGTGYPDGVIVITTKGEEASPESLAVRPVALTR